MSAEQPRRRRVPREERLRDIVREASRLFMEKGYEQTSVDELATAMDVSVGSLYRFVATKSDVLVMVCEDIYAGLPEQLAELASGHTDARARLEAVMRRYFESCAVHRRLILLLYREFRHLPEAAQQRSRAKEDAIVALFSTLLREVKPELARESARLIATDLALLGHLPALKGWQLRSTRTSLERTLDTQIRLLLQSFA